MDFPLPTPIISAVSYHPNDAGASDYTVQKRKQNSNGSWGTWGTHATVTSTSRAFGYRELVDGNWQFQVRANTTNVGSSGWRGTVSVTVEHTPPTPTLSSPMTDLDGSYTVSWTTSSGVVNHKLQESTLSGNTWGSWTTYNVAGTSKAFFKPDGNYRYRVQACKTFVCSAWSAISYTEVGYGGGGGCLMSTESEPANGTDTTTTTETSAGDTTNGPGNDKNNPGGSDDNVAPQALPGC